MKPTSLAVRAAWAAFASAAVAAAITAIVASTLANVLLAQQTDERLRASATELARELEAAPDAASAVAREQEEATSAGVRLTLYGAGKLLAGDPTSPLVFDAACSTRDELRICRVPLSGDRHVVAATRLVTSRGWAASLVAAVVAGAVAWVIARILSRRAVAPLLHLQTSIANQPLDRSVARDALGRDEGVTEVDALRRTLVELFDRMHDALGRSERFAANAAHELRTPLTSLRAELELMGEASTSREEQVVSLRVALRKVAHLQALTERLLVLATPQRDAGDGFTLVSMRDVVDDAIAALPPEDHARVVVADEEDVFVRGDPEALGIVVSNGLSNALKFGTFVRLELSASGDRARLAIEDDGPGVEEAERTHLFEPFVRGTGSRTVPGHGLGLALVAHVAERHHGQAQLTGAKHGGHGARLEIELPLAPQE